MRTDKTFASVRGDILADIEAVRMGNMPPATALAIFAGYKTAKEYIDTEINITKLALHAEATGHGFAQVVRLGRRVINSEDAEDTTARRLGT